MTTFQMDLADRWLVVPLGDADAVVGPAPDQI